MKKTKLIPETKNTAQPKESGKVPIPLSQYLEMLIRDLAQMQSALYIAKDAAANQEKQIAELEAKQKPVP